MEEPNFDSFMNRLSYKKLWQPTFDVKTGFPILIIMSSILLLLSFLMLGSFIRVFEMEIDYTHCVSLEQPTNSCYLLAADHKPCTCMKKFTISKKSLSYLHFYVKIDKMYQNHRLYSTSYDINQHLGNKLSSSISESCGDFKYVNGRPIAPCGLVANSLLNDSFALFLNGSRIPFSSDGLRSFSEKKLFRNPPGDPLSSAFADFEKPPNWKVPIYELDPKHPENNGFLNVQYINWIRIYPLPNTLKLIANIPKTYGQIPCGDYSFIINYNYPVHKFKGRKKIIISQASWLGRPGNRLGYIYFSALIISILFTIFFKLIVFFELDKPTRVMERKI